MADINPVESLFALGDGKFEWVHGRVIEHPPVSAEECNLRGFLASSIGFFAEERGGGRVFGGLFLERLGPDLVRSPDVAYLSRRRSSEIKTTHLQGGADLVVEIVSPDSRLRDRGEKFYEYEAAGIEEYWIVDPERRRAEFYRLREGAYEPVLPDAEGKVHSSALKGFFIRVEWLWNRPKVLDALRELGVL